MSSPGVATVYRWELRKLRSQKRTYMGFAIAIAIPLIFVIALALQNGQPEGILFGRYVLRMNPLILLGACAGAGTITAALRAVEDASDSKLPALGYTVPYAIGNILLTAWGPVIVALMTIGR